MVNFYACGGAAMMCHETAMERAERDIGIGMKKYRKPGTEIPVSMGPRPRPSSWGRKVVGDFETFTRGGT